MTGCSMTTSAGHDSFHETRWSLVVNARHSPEHLEELLRAYWPPVYSSIRARGYSIHDAADLTQAFLTHVLLGRDMVDIADPTRGRFRAFIKTALQRYLVDEHRREHGRSGDRGVTFLPDVSVLADTMDQPEDDPSEAFDRQWATTVLNAALERVEADYRKRGQVVAWRAFEMRVLGPVKGTGPSPALPEIASAVGESDTAKLSKLIHGVKQSLRLALRDVVAETVAKPDDIDPELRDLMGALGM